MLCLTLPPTKHTQPLPHTPNKLQPFFKMESWVSFDHRNREQKGDTSAMCHCHRSRLHFPVELAVESFPLGAFLPPDCLAAEWKRALCLLRRNVCQFECNFPALQEAQKGIADFHVGGLEGIWCVCWD